MEPPDAAVTTTLQALRERARQHPYDPDRTIATLQTAARSLLQTDTAARQQLLAALETSTGLSRAMISWGLDTTLQSLLDAPLTQLIAALPPQPKTPEVIGVVLSGNVFCAALRALSLPLLAGAHVVAKAASAESAFARAWRDALLAADSGIGERLVILQFPRTDQNATRALCQNVDALSIYGDDTTVEHLASFAANSCRIVPHGHGVSAAYVSRTQLASAHAAAQAAERVALDVAAYDQYGCLSPQFIAVEPGGAISPQAFAELLAHHALPELARRLPPAATSLDLDAARMQWRAAASVRGELYAHDTHAVSFEDTLPARPSPGGRLVAVHSCEDQSALRQLLEPFAAHLKLIGIAAATPTEHATLSTFIRTFSSADTCAAGTMQTPAFDAWADGRPPFAGLLPEGP